MCGVCERTVSLDKQAELPKETYKAVVESAARHLGTTIASISGGEPLLRKDIFEIIRYAAEAGLSVHICTNGLLLNEERAKRLRDSGIAAVSISIDSPEPGLHEYLRGPGAFQPAVDAIRLLRRTAPQVQIGINYLVTRLNYMKMMDMVDFAEALGVHQIKFAPVHTNLLHRHKDKEEFKELYFLPEELNSLQQEINKLKKRCKSSRLSTTSQTFFDGIVPFYKVPRKFRCYAGYAVCAIGPSGQVSPCCDMDSPFSVKDRALEQIWRDPAFHQLRLKASQCQIPCWDTTNTELSLRLGPWSLIRNLAENWRDLRFYSGNRHK